MPIKHAAGVDWVHGWHRQGRAPLACHGGEQGILAPPSGSGGAAQHAPHAGWSARAEAIDALFKRSTPLERDSGQPQNLGLSPSPPRVQPARRRQTHVIMRPRTAAAGTALAALLLALTVVPPPAAAAATAAALTVAQKQQATARLLQQLSDLGG